MAEDVVQPWLALHCQTLPGAVQGLVVLSGSGLGAPLPVAHWPKQEAEASDLLGVARESLAEGGVVVRRSDQAPGSTLCWSDVAIPFGAGSPFGGAVAIRMEHTALSAEAACRRASDHLQSGVTWLEGLVRGANARDRLVTALEVVATALEQNRPAAAATAVATELAQRLGCDRVSIGLMRGRQIRVEGLSNAASFDARSSIIGDIEAAMDEAADQDALLCHPPLGDGPPRVALAQERLIRSQNGAAAWTVPLGSEGRVIGGLTFERSSSAALDAETIALCEDVSALLGPILELKRQARQSWLEAVREVLGLQIARLRAPGHLQLKAAATGVVAALLMLVLARGDYRVTADATLEGRVQRAIVAGIDGYIAEANVRAGDLLKSGEIMARLDDRDLLLERRNWSGKLAQLVKEHRKALAQHDRSQVNFLSARIDQAEAEFQLLEAQLERTRLVAPFDGIVVKGDLSQSLGSPVERGELLFEIAPLDGYRIILKVDQRDIGEPKPGQPGKLALTALPGKQLPLTVQRITPVSIAEGGSNYFRVEAHLDEPAPGLRPGMEGVGKIEVGRRRLIWIWTHGLTDWLRLWTWSWLP